MNAKKQERQKHFWEKVTAFLLTLAIATGWIIFDCLFAPFAANAVTVEIPNCCGQRLDALLLPDWLTVEVDYRYDANTAAGVVLSQSPVGGSYRKLVPPDSSYGISLVVSLGEETVILPNMVGRDIREVTSELRKMGLCVESQTVEGAYPEGKIFAAEPRSGTEVPIGTKVMLSVSGGMPCREVTVPDVRGLTRADALVQLWLAQLEVAQVLQAPSEAPEGTVFRQSHQPGTLVTAGTKITLYVSQIPEE